MIISILIFVQRSKYRIVVVLMIQVSSNLTNKQRETNATIKRTMQVPMTNLLFMLRSWNRKDSAIKGRRCAHL